MAQKKSEQLDMIALAEKAVNLPIQNITLEDVGPITRLVLPVVPGVVVLRGESEVGKSIGLQAASALAGGPAKLTKRDGSVSGSIEGLGIKITLRQSARRTGELAAQSLEDDLNIVDLVSPPIKEPVAADKHRIKALLKLAGTKADIHLFDCLGDVGRHISKEAAVTDDLVEMAARIKRDLEQASRVEASAAQKAEAQAFALRQQAEGVDLSVETDADILQGRLEDAVDAQSTMAADAKHATETHRQANVSRELLSQARAADVQGASLALEFRISETERCNQDVLELEQRLAAAKGELKGAQAAEVSAGENLNLERAQADTLAKWHQTIDAAVGIEVPAPQSLNASAQAVTDARKAIEVAAIARKAQDAAFEAEQLAGEAKAHAQAAEQLRDAAKGTDEVLSNAVASDNMVVKDGRLVTIHPTRGEVYLSDRSDGTRWKLAIDELVKRVRQLGPDKVAFATIPQWAWSEMSNSGRLHIHNYALKMGVTLYAAQADFGELRAEPFSASTLRE